jgi:hypothetical protein
MFLDMAGQALGGLGEMVGVDGSGVQAGFGGLALIAVILGAYSFVAGVLGIAWRNNLEKAATLVIVGSINFVADIISAFILDTFSVTTLVLLAIPACYVFGALKNKTHTEA